MNQSIELQINGVKRKVEVDPSASLLETLREVVCLTGTKYGCGEGQCGACTVMIDGQAVHSCITPVSEVTGQSITTIEGLEKNGALHPVQQAFLDHGAMQCGYCASGMIMGVVAFLRANPNPTDTEISQHMSGNICRCGGYPRMVAAIREAAQNMRGKK